MQLSPLVHDTYRIEGGKTYEFPPSIFPGVVCRVYWEEPPLSWYLAGYISLLGSFPVVGLTVLESAKVGINEPRLLLNQYGGAIAGITFSPVNWMVGKTVTFAAWGIQNGE